MSVFVTGATGFVGSHMCKKLTDNGYTVVAMRRDCFQTKWLKEALDKCIKVTGDIRDLRFLKRVINQYEVEEVYHFAAQPIVKYALKNPIETFDVNVIGTATLLEACRELGVNKVLVMSTDKVYGNRMNATELDQPQIVEPYQASKICQETVALTYLIAYKMNIVIPRACNIYGYDLSSRIIPNTIRTCLRGENPVIFEGEKTVRQYIYVEDVTDALLYLMSKWTKGIFNIATDDVKTQEEVVLEILKHFPNLKPRYVKRERPIEIEKQSMLMKDFGWKPKYTFEEGIKETIEKFKEYGF